MRFVEEMASTKIFIGAVPPNAREEDVHELFGAHGSIEKVFMKQGFAFVVSHLVCSL